jgi:hypothetical protein
MKAAMDAAPKGSIRLLAQSALIVFACVEHAENDHATTVNRVDDRCLTTIRDDPQTSA